MLRLAFWAVPRSPDLEREGEFPPILPLHWLAPHVSVATRAHLSMERPTQTAAWPSAFYFELLHSGEPRVCVLLGILLRGGCGLGFGLRNERAQVCAVWPPCRTVTFAFHHATCCCSPHRPPQPKRFVAVYSARASARRVSKLSLMQPQALGVAASALARVGGAGMRL
jgi:hypothetical protein